MTKVLRLRRMSVLVLASLAVVAVTFSLIGRQVVRVDGRHLLERQTGEVSALLTNSFSGVDASLRALTAVADPSDPSARAFVQSAGPLVVGQTRAILLVQLDGRSISRVAIVGDGVPEGPLTADRAALVRRAATQPGLVTGVIADDSRRRVGLARGPWPNPRGWIVYQESAIDPSNPNQPTSGRPFGELDIVMYASATPRPDSLVLATTKDISLRGDVARVTIPVGVDRWLVLARSPHPLVGTLATEVPWILLIVGLATAVLACAVVEVISRRRDFAVGLVDERTVELRATVAELEAAQAELVRQAFADDLTGLANRALFLDRLENALARATRGRSMPVVMFLDVDRFKWVNDSLGHEVGDQLLIALASRLADAVRPGDTVARIGGDEFVVLCEGPTDIAAMRKLAERLQLSVAPSFPLGARELHVSVSIGLAMARADERMTAEELMRNADLAMYRAKELGRDRVEVFDEPMRRAAVERLGTETALRRAVENHEFEVHYQPIVDLATERVIGVEALVRWRTPDGFLVMPDDFIPLAEDCGLISPIGEIVLRDACSVVARWNLEREIDGRAPLNLAVNLSTRQLTGSELPRVVEATLRASGLPAALLSLEITESTLMEGETARLALDHLKALGATLVVDDFGTGYSSLVYLRRFPVDVLKIDKSFVAGMHDNPEDRAIVTGVIGLAQALGLRSVAEGVETVVQLDQLTALGCEMAQGYHWSRPLPAAAFASWLLASEGRFARSKVSNWARPGTNRPCTSDSAPSSSSSSS